MNRQRMQGIDALRGVAALAVVTLHLSTDFNRQYHPAQPVPFGLPFGGYGVYLFFVISGYVIAMTTAKTGHVRDFAVSRFSRLFPVYWMALLLSTIILLCTDLHGTASASQIVRNAVLNVLMVENWFGVPVIDSVYWTLHVEMTFYGLMGLLIWLKRLHWALPIMLATAVIGGADQLIFAEQVSPLHRHVRFVLMLQHASFFAAGMVLYRARDGFKAWHLAALALCALLPLTRTYWPHHPIEDALAAAVAMALVYLGGRGKLVLLERWPWLFLGSVSYALYVSHHWLGVTVMRAADRAGHGGWQGFVLAGVVCLLVAQALTVWVERPGLKLLRGVFAR